MRVSYYWVRTGKNPGIAVVYGNWPARSLQHRGWHNLNLVFTREAITEEVEEVSRMTRFYSHRYRDICSLLEDEKRILPMESYEALKAALKAQSKLLR